MTLRPNRLFWVFLPVLIIGVFYFATRLFHLTILPIFTDEAIYIRWSQIGSRDANWRFISLVDGKQPLYTWFVMVMMRFIHDPLVAGRFVSVLAGAVNTLGLYFLGKSLFRNARIGVIASCIYVLSPFALMYDRMALYDSLSATFYIWGLYVAVLFAQTPRLDLALLLGMVIGGGVLNKTSGFLGLYLLPTTILLIDWNSKKRTQLFWKWIGGLFIAAFLSQAIYSILRLSPLFYMIKQKDSTFVYPVVEWLKHPFTFLEGNLKGLFDWLVGYLTWPLWIVTLLSTVWPKNTREKLLLLIWWFAPFFALALFGKVLYPRYILFMTMPLFVLAAYSLNWLWERTKKTVIGYVIIGGSLFFCIIADYYILMNPAYAPIPEADKGQYVNNWPAGWGVSETNAFFAERAKNAPVHIYTEGTFGLFPYATEIYLVDTPNITIRGLWPLPTDMPENMANDAETVETYFILNQDQTPPPEWSLELLSEYQKGNRKDRKLRLYKVLPQSDISIPEGDRDL